MKRENLFNDGWQFAKTALTGRQPETGWQPVEIPHDWLIWDTENLYQDGIGWYKKEFSLSPEQLEGCLYLRFDGVYMDSTVYINGETAFEWKYGYSTFTFDCSAWTQAGRNEILVRVVHQAPNSRWYSGAGIYRNVWMLACPKVHVVPDGVYITPVLEGGGWRVEVEAELSQPCRDVSIRHRVLNQEGRAEAQAEGGLQQTLTVQEPCLWDMENPVLYTLETCVEVPGQPEQTIYTNFGFRSIRFEPDTGFWLNGRRLKLLGVCQHHDLGCLGAAITTDGLRRQMQLLQSMGANSIRTAHNMPAPELMQLADEMGMLVVSEAFDIWEKSKNEFDYARFFPEWWAKDVDSWVRRDRNHPSLIMWSLGNEILDTHTDGRGLELTRMLCERVRRQDPKQHAPVTLGSNYMFGENAQQCADYVKIAGYNYSEKLYALHHAAHPDWVIYGSETGSVVQSRGIYHFPLRQPLLAEEDLQCSALGNSATSWGASSTETCILADFEADFSAGQFIWTGTDYIGEPTPYHTKSSYFGQIDTAGFPKDSFYIFKAGWTDWRKEPFVHIFPYWDFSPGQPIDVRVCSNAPEVELFFNGASQGRVRLGREQDRLIADYNLPYQPGSLTAKAYSPEGAVLAECKKLSFGNASRLVLNCWQHSLPADGKSLAFVTVTAVDDKGVAVENATNRVRVKVQGAGRLMGLDNGDSADFEQYKTVSRRLFSGKLLAVIGSGYTPGQILVRAESLGLQGAELSIQALPSGRKPGMPEFLLSVPGEGPVPHEVPARKIELVCKTGFALTEQCPEAVIEAVVHPAEADPQQLEWMVTDAAGIPSYIARVEPGQGQVRLTAFGDGEIWVKCQSKNGRGFYSLASQLCFTASGLGKRNINPYEFVSAGLYTDTDAELTNGNEKGIATPRETKSYVGFQNLDFGAFGADSVTLPVFSLTKDPFPIEIWEGVPDKEGAALLCEAQYTSGSIWNTYQQETYTLPRRLAGIKTVSFVFRQKVHLKGFVFHPADKAFQKLFAAENDGLYGDSFEVKGNSVEKIGNNVTILFSGMDYSARLPKAIEICGRTPLGSQPLRIQFAPESGGEQLEQTVEFQGSAEENRQSFSLEGRLSNGVYRVEFVFLPGSQFDFRWFQFL